MEGNKLDITQLKADDLMKDLPEMVQSLDALRSGTASKLPVDISLGEFVQEKYGVSQEDYLQKIQINPRLMTMQNIYSMPRQDVNWIIPEIIRDAITLGVRQAPFYPNIIASDQPISGLQAIMPSINISDATPAKINEAETIPLGDISFGQKSVRLFKIGKGFKITDEVKNYVSLDVLGIYLRDYGIQLGYAMDTLAMDVLQNGNKPDNSEAAVPIGVYNTGNGITYKDLTRIWVRAARMGRSFQDIIGGEDQAIDLLNLPEFKDRKQGTTEANLTVKTPIPKNANFYVHPGTAEHSLLLIDRSAALIKLTAKALTMESERIVSNQTSAIYTTLTTGFCKMYQDSVIKLCDNHAFSEAGYSFPSFMEKDGLIQANLE